MNLSFCGCGFLSIYHLGAVQGLITHGPRFLNSVEKVAGASGGALMATALVCDRNNLKECKEFALDLSKQVRQQRFGAFNPSVKVLDPIAKFLNTYLPEDCHKIASETLHVSITAMNSWRPRHELVSDFSSKHDLVEAVLLSCSIPGYTGVGRKNDRIYLDGGFTNNLYKFDDGRTVTVSPFSGAIDISPDDNTKYDLNVTVANMNVVVNIQNVTRAIDGAWPPEEKTFLNYYERGYIDAINFLKKEKFYQSASERTWRKQKDETENTKI